MQATSRRHRRQVTTLPAIWWQGTFNKRNIIFAFIGRQYLFRAFWCKQPETTANGSKHCRVQNFVRLFSLDRRAYSEEFVEPQFNGGYTGPERGGANH